MPHGAAGSTAIASGTRASTAANAADRASGLDRPFGGEALDSGGVVAELAQDGARMLAHLRDRRHARLAFREVHRRPPQVEPPAGGAGLPPAPPGGGPR